MSDALLNDRSDPPDLTRVAGDSLVEGTSLVVEILGLAGSGKTTLSKALCQSRLGPNSGWGSGRGQRIVAGKRLAPTKPKQLPFYLSHLLTLPPALFLPRRDDRRISRREMKNLVYLKGWPGVLKRQARRRRAVVVVDQGGVFKLTNLHGFGPRWLLGGDFEDWWEGMFQRWASVMNMVICLDAPDEVLVKRIRSRNTWHVLKEVSNQEAFQFLSTYRSSCEYVLSRLTASNQVKLLHIDTACRRPEQVLRDVLTALHAGAKKPT